MSTGEQRTTHANTEFDPHRWQALTETIGGLSLVNEAKYDPAVLFCKEDFYAFAGMANTTLHQAGRAWDYLDRIHREKQYPEHYGSYGWYKPENYEHVPELFEEVIIDENGSPVESRGLRLEALRTYVASVHERMDEFAHVPRDRRAGKVLGRGAGNNTLKFWEILLATGDRVVQR